MTSFGSRHFRKHREIKNGEQYIILDISYNIDFLYKSEATSSNPNDYMGIPGKGMTNYLDLRTKMSNKKEKERFSITDINN